MFLAVNLVPSYKLVSQYKMSLQSPITFVLNCKARFVDLGNPLKAFAANEFNTIIQ